MTLLAMRILAIIAWPAHLVAATAGQALWFTRLHAPWTALVAVGLGLGSWAAFADAQRAEAARPSPSPTSVAELVRDGGSGWLALQAVVDGPVWDSDAYGAGVLRYYYVLSDPHDTSVALLARSPDRLEQRRERTIRARVVGEPPALTPAPEANVHVRTELHLVELDVGPPAADAPPRPISDLSAGLGEATVRARFASLGSAPCASESPACVGGVTYRYLATDDSAAVVIESPFPPDALPVDLSGVPTSDPARIEQARAQAAVAASIGDRSTPTSILFAEGVTPPFFEVSYAPAVLLAGLAGLLALGWLFGYPIWEMRAPRQRLATPPLAEGTAIELALTGWIAGPGGRVHLNGAPALLERLDPDELERRSWQYTQTGGPLLTHPSPSGGRQPRLVLHSGHEGLLLGLEPPPVDMSLRAGRLHRLGATQPALRIRSAQLDLTVAVEGGPDLLRVLAEIDPGWRTSIERVVPHELAQQHVASPRQLSTAIAIFGALGGGLAAMGILTAVGGLVRRDLGALPGALALGVLAAVLITVALGLRRRRDWAPGIGFTVGWVGALLAAFLAWAPTDCLARLGPGLNDCRPAGIVQTLIALLAAAGLAYAAWVLRRPLPFFNH